MNRGGGRLCESKGVDELKVEQVPSGSEGRREVEEQGVELKNLSVGNLEQTGSR